MHPPLKSTTTHAVECSPCARMMRLTCTAFAASRTLIVAQASDTATSLSVLPASPRPIARACIPCARTMTSDTHTHTLAVLDGLPVAAQTTSGRSWRLKRWNGPPADTRARNLYVGTARRPPPDTSAIARPRGRVRTWAAGAFGNRQHRNGDVHV